MKILKTLVAAPVISPAGVVTVPGFHEPTGVFADFDDDLMTDFPETPTRSEIVAALRQIWRPFEAYRFASPADRGALMASIIGGLARAGLNDAPGVLFDAPCAGSGKTKAAAALGALILGRRAPITPFAGVDDVELRKQLIANALSGFPWLLLDNVTGHFDSAVMAAMLTGSAIRDRILGTSTVFDGEVRATVVMTSNNASLSRDMHRRFIRIRIDTGVAQPQSLEFLFDPVERALTERLAIVRAVCVVVQAFFAAGQPRLGRGDAGYPAWSRLVRDCVLWIEREGFARVRCGADGEALDEDNAGIGDLGDPAHAIVNEAGAADPASVALSQLLLGLRGVFGGETFFARDVLSLIAPGACAAFGSSAGDKGKAEAVALIGEAIEALLPARATPSVRSIGGVLRYRVDAVSDGYVLRQSLDPSTKTNFYCVQMAGK